MSENKIRELKELLEAAAKQDRDYAYYVEEIGKLILMEAMFGGIIVKNTDDGYTVTVEV